MKIMILVPCYEKVDALFAFDLAQMMALTVAAMPADAGVELGLSMNIGTYAHSSRQELVNDALAQGATHILWLDSDMRFPRDLLIRLLQHQVPVVGINYSKRRFPPDFVAIEEIDIEKNVSKRLLTRDEDEGLAEVHALGFGAVLMERSVFVNLPDPEEQPWFWFEYLGPGRGQIGEDVYFCRLIREHGQRIFVDQDLSKECGHLGQFEYKVHHAAIDYEAETEE